MRLQLYPYTHTRVSFGNLMSNPWSLQAVLSPYESTGCLLFLHQGWQGTQSDGVRGYETIPAYFFDTQSSVLYVNHLPRCRICIVNRCKSVFQPWICTKLYNLSAITLQSCISLFTIRGVLYILRYILTFYLLKPYSSGMIVGIIGSNVHI